MMSDPSALHQKTPTRHRAILAGTGLLLLAICGAGWWWLHSEARADQLLQQARSRHLAGDDQTAEALAVAALQLKSNLVEAAWLAAECAQAQGEYARAVEHARRVTRGPFHLQLQAALQIAQWSRYRLHRLSDTEQACRRVLLLHPGHARASMELARLLAMCGRRREAVPHVLELIRQEVDTDLLILLAVDDAVIRDPEALMQAHAAAPDDAGPLIGLAWLAAQNERTDEAVALLQKAVEKNPGHAAAAIALCRELMKAGRMEALTARLKLIPEGARADPELWLVLARFCEQSDLTREAVRCYYEAVRRGPELKTACFRIAQLLTDAGEHALARPFSEHVSRLQQLDQVQNRLLFQSDLRSNQDALLELVQASEAAGRLWEAYAWCQAASRIRPVPAEVPPLLERFRQRAKELPLTLCIDSANPALAVDLSHYPLPDLVTQPQSGASSAESMASPGAITFRDDSEAAGLRFRYFNGVSGEPQRRMYEFTGGGIGVLDFDRDGWPDACFTQGRPWPLTQPAGNYGDRLFRNLGQSFLEVSLPARLQEDGFGQGLSVSDFDSDGFPDLYLANIGRNELWLNNGDGTWTRQTDRAGLNGAEWTTSCVMADLNGDGHPDLYDVNYVMADDVFDRVCRDAQGQPRMCMPFDFQEQPDRLWINRGDGSFEDQTEEDFLTTPGGMGLGIAVWDAHGTGQLSLFVANDTTPSFFLVRETGEDGVSRFRDNGIETGLALNADGKATGCMGVALCDVNRDGRMDLHVTNFLNESSTLFVSTRTSLFEDRTRALGLLTDSLNVLGFGTQFLDADLDGQAELFVANGHIDDLSRTGRPYRMPPHVFRWDGSRFNLLSPAETGPYFQQDWLGRSAARIDWNRDGRDDLLVGHLYDDSVLLTNTTAATNGQISLELVGVRSGRDAIGTTIQARLAGQTIVLQLTAGDGYQASNERRLAIGTGSHRSVDELTVRWPSGLIQQFRNVTARQNLKLVEGQSLSEIP